MKRQLVATGLIAFALLLFILIAVGMAAPSNSPLWQTVSESEPNDSCNTAQQISVGDSVGGAIQPITDTDWFSLTTTAGTPYIASASVGPADFRVRLCVYADSGGTCAQMSCSSASDSYIEEEFDATGGMHFVKIERFEAVTDTLWSATYVLEVAEQYVPPPTATSTSTPPPSVSTGDPYETHGTYTDNNSMAQAYPLPVATSLTLSSYGGVANFHTLDTPNPPGRDRDWFSFWGKDGYWYQVTTSELSGVDTRIVIYKSNGEQVTSNDDGGGGYASMVNFEASYDGYYYIKVENKVNTTGTYNMTFTQIDEPAPGATSTPGPGPASSADDCEDNGDFGKACVIAANDAKTFNFYPPYGGVDGVDNDFYKVWIKPGFNYECSTSYLDAGIDPNLIVFTGPSWDNSVGGNDDVETGDLNSYFAYYAGYEGWLYLLVGYGDRTPSDISNSNYTFECKMSTPGSPTKTPAPTAGAATAVPTKPPSATATPAGLTVRSLTTPTPVPESGAPPTSQFMRIKVVVYYDANNDRQPGAGEGVEQVSVKAYAADTNEHLTQDFTDEQGYLEITVSAQGPVRVSIPYFGFSQLVSGEEATVRLRVPAPLLPGGEPQ
jgi:hypothetical protein